MKVHLITKNGPEWQKPVEAWVSKRKATDRVKELDAKLDEKDALDSLSRHGITVIELKDG